MSITINPRSGVQEISGVSRERGYVAMALVILLVILVCATAASFYADAPVSDALLVGP